MKTDTEKKKKTETEREKETNTEMETDRHTEIHKNTRSPNTRHQARRISVYNGNE